MLTIAIDGPAASGKGTLAKRVAAHYGLSYLDTGLLYRAVGRDILAAGRSLDDEGAAIAAARHLKFTTLGDPALRLASMGEAASVVARFAAVRTALLTFQRDFARQEPGAVLDGRDIGTVILPDADAKLYVTAEVEVRACRRYQEQLTRGEPVTCGQVLDVIKARDARDMGRVDAPLKPAEDAMILDTTELDVDASFVTALSLLATKIGR